MDTLANYLVEQVLKELNEGVTVFLPGGFKPPHAGHLELAKKYASQPNVSEVRILIGPKERDGITLQQSMDIWRLLLRGASGIKVEKATNDNPMRAAYEFIEQAAPGTYALGSSSKGKDYDRVKMFVAGHADATDSTPAGKYNRANVSVVELPIDTAPMVYSGRDDDKNGQGISASVLRADIAAGNYNNFKTNYPGQSDTITKAIYSIVADKQPLSEAIVADYTKKVKKHFKDFIKNIKAEGVENKKAFSLLVQAAAGKKKITKKEKTQIGNQMKDALKAAGLVAASVIPGGTIYFILVRLLRLDDYVYPTRFLSKNAVSAGTVALGERSLYEWRPATGKLFLTEGGAAGHMSHPFDDLDLTFGDAKSMIQAALNGEVEFAQEKLDGQNLMVTYKDGKVRAARNKGQLKNFAEKSITADELDQMMSGKGAVQTAFVEAMRDMESAINKLDPKQKEDFFQNGKKFINFEVLFPGTTNVVPYGATQLRLHGFKEYDQDGNVVDEDSEGALKLQGAIDQVQAQNQKTYQIRVTDPIQLNKTADYEKQSDELLKALDNIRRTYNLKESDKMSLYFQAWWKNYIEQRAKEMGYQVPDNTMQQLINRWGFGDKSTNIKAVRQGVDNQDFLRWVDEFDKSGVAPQQKEAKRPLENLFLKLGVYVLQNIQQLVAINPNDSVQNMRNDLAASIKSIRAAANSPEMQDDGKSLQFLKRELQRLQDLGGFKAIVPTEGIVFKYQGKLYKLTGAFAPVNQIIGYIKFGR